MAYSLSTMTNTNTVLSSTPYGTRVVRQGGYLGIEGSRQQAKKALQSAHNHGGYEGKLMKISDKFFALSFQNPVKIQEWLAGVHRLRFDAERLESKPLRDYLMAKAAAVMATWPTGKFVVSRNHEAMAYSIGTMGKPLDE